ncbi:hypothetical protein L0156_25350 [bacterium]|nr:hypothetical protein [bacterium]
MGDSKKRTRGIPSWIDPQTGVLSISSKKILTPLMSLSEFLRTPLGAQAVLTEEDRNVDTYHHLGAFAYQKGILRKYSLGKHLIARNAFTIEASFLNNQLFQITLHPESPSFGATEKIRMQKLEDWMKSQAGPQWPSWNWLWGTYSLNSNYDPRWSEKIYATLDVRWGRINQPAKPWWRRPYVLAVAVEKRPAQKLIHRFVDSKRRCSLQWMTDDSDCYQALIVVKCPHKSIEHLSVRVGLTYSAFLPKVKEFKKAHYLIILSLSAYHCGPQFELVDELARRIIKSCRGATMDTKL